MKHWPKDVTRRYAASVLVPTPGLRDIYSLISNLRSPERVDPEVRAVGLRLTWVEGANRHDRSVIVSRDLPNALPFGSLYASGVLEMATTCCSDDVIALRNLAAEPERRFRRFGFDTQLCPFCDQFLEYGSLDSSLGHCQSCGEVLDWPCNQFTADRADYELRADIIREIEDENRDS